MEIFNNPVLKFIFQLIGLTVIACIMCGVYWIANRAEHHKQDKRWARVVIGIFYVFIVMIHASFFSLLFFPLKFKLSSDGIVVADEYWYLFLLFFVLGIVLLIKPCVRLLERIMPINSTNNLHIFALSSSMLSFSAFVLIGMFMQYDLWNLSDWVLAYFRTYANYSWPELLLELIINLYNNAVLPCLSAIFAVGYLSRRHGTAVMQRLGLARLTSERMLRGVKWAVLMAVIVIGFELAIEWGSVGVSEEEAKIQQFFQGIDQAELPIVYTKLLLSTCILSLCAGVGEEIMFRGLLQPRLGIIFTSILFVLIHPQYLSNWTGLVIVFCASIVLGKLRQKYDTTTTMVVHTVYDVILFVLTIFNPFI